MKDLNLLVWLTQLGLSAVVPLGGFILLAVWLRNTFSLGGWVIAVGIVLGVFCAARGFWHALKLMERMAQDKKDPPPPAFNDHD